MRRDDDGFTLVEILVVMLILGVLAAIAIPVFLGQQEKAFRSVLVSDMRTLQMAQASRAVNGQPRYTDDLDDLRAEGFARSEPVVGVNVDLFDQGGEQEYVACLKHEGLDDWLVFNSLSGVTTYSPTECVAPS